MCQLASEKDRGFSHAVLVEMLGSLDRLTADELGIDEPDRRSLAASVQRWREALTRPATRSIHPSDRGPDLSRRRTRRRQLSTRRRIGHRAAWRPHIRRDASSVRAVPAAAA